jgi:hypothetical protein
MEADMSYSRSATLLTERDFVEATPPASTSSLIDIRSQHPQAIFVANPSANVQNWLARFTGGTEKNMDWHFYSMHGEGLRYFCQPPPAGSILRTGQYFWAPGQPVTFAYSDVLEGLPLTSPNFSRKYSSELQLFEAVRVLRLSSTSRNIQIADRLVTLSKDASDEGVSILADSTKQFAEFFLTHRNLALPKITVTPDATLRVRWISGKEN